MTHTNRNGTWRDIAIMLVTFCIGFALILRP